MYLPEVNLELEIGKVLVHVFVRVTVHEVYLGNGRRGPIDLQLSCLECRTKAQCVELNIEHGT